MAGIPRVSLVVLAGVLTSFHYPLLGVAILLGIDQILDMGRTTVNLIGNCVATVVVACWEREFDYEKNKRYVGLSHNRPINLRSYVRYRRILKARHQNRDSQVANLR